MSKQFVPLTGIVTTDLSVITRGRFVPENKFDSIKSVGIGWIPSNLSLAPFNCLASHNVWGASGDLRLIPDQNARYRSNFTGAVTAFDMNIYDLVEMDGSTWSDCPRTFLKNAIQALYDATG